MHLGFFIDVEKQIFLIIGGGKVASRKANKLAEAGATVIAVGPEFRSGFSEKITQLNMMVNTQNFVELLNEFDPQFVVLATNDHDLHLQLITICKNNKILVNDSQNGYTKMAFANTTKVNNSIISYFSHGNMEATRVLKAQVENFIQEIKED